jgi:hypothetical protein
VRLIDRKKYQGQFYQPQEGSKGKGENIQQLFRSAQETSHSVEVVIFIFYSD